VVGKIYSVRSRRSGRVFGVQYRWIWSNRSAGSRNHTCAARSGADSSVAPPKAAFLKVNLTNRKTRQPISGMEITVLHKNNPPSLAFTMSCASSKTVLLPPGQDLLVHITSKGFREWDETVGGGKALHLQSVHT
jgi:hypothetical protein